VSSPAIHVEPDLDLHSLAVSHWPIHYLVCDEAQFYTPEQCEQLARVVDDLEVDVYAFGLITDFRGRLFEGTKRMLELADERVPLQVEARCWCGSRATHNARVVNGEVVYEGETVVVGDTADPSAQRLFGDTVRYELLCRRHYREGDTGT
jgi:thymidine kinase